MTESEFQGYVSRYADQIQQIRESAHALHASVNETYDRVHPYGYHLDMVAEEIAAHGHEVCAAERDVLPLFFGAYYHDSIEDARFTYNDTVRAARRWMDEQQAQMAAEIVYALTNDKGRTRAERAGENYFRGIRQTPYAPFVKLADRLANTTYSFTHDNKPNNRMKNIYRAELPAFLEAINARKTDVRFGLPGAMMDELQRLVTCS